MNPNSNAKSSLSSRIESVLAEFKEKLLVEFRAASIDEIVGVGGKRHTPQEFMDAIDVTNAKPYRPPVKTKARQGPNKAEVATWITQALEAAGPDGVRVEILRKEIGSPHPRVFHRAMQLVRKTRFVRARGYGRGMVYSIGKKPGPKRGVSPTKKKVSREVSSQTRRTKKAATTNSAKAKATEETAATPTTATPATEPQGASGTPQTRTDRDRIHLSYANHIIERLGALPSPKMQARYYLQAFGVKRVRDIPAAMFKEALERLDALEKEHGIENVRRFEEQTTPTNGTSQ